MPHTLFVSGFHPSTRARDLAYAFERFGPLVRCDVPAPRNPYATYNPYAFVEYRSSRDAQDAYYDMNGRNFEGLRLSLQWARNPPSSVWRYDRRTPPPPTYRSRRSHSRSPRRRDERDRDREHNRERDREREKERDRDRDREFRDRRRSRSPDRARERDRDRDRERRSRSPDANGRRDRARTPPTMEDDVLNGKDDDRKDREKDSALTPPY